MTLPGARRLQPQGAGPILGAVLAGAAALIGCGEATAREITVPESSISFVVPREFDDLGGVDGPAAVYGRPGSNLDEVGDEPVLFMTSIEHGDLASFAALRMLSTNGEYDPVDQVSNGDGTVSLQASGDIPADSFVIDYEEIAQPDVWGIRIKLAVGSAARDFQALVTRATDRVVITELTCTQSCFLEQADLIQKIQASWSLES
ncbi:MAG: hypothetical protein OEY41_01015 [Acidimicrobiia bacterium]|nr:hypothetical protein [Acidimicrobiia bacterium]MDH5288558.1 hypothetical protein [Acidimicrobiia bacterium]